MVAKARPTALDRVAFRLGELYQDLGRLMPKRSMAEAEWVRVLDEVVSLTAEVERIINRNVKTKRAP